jgi:hypothetical protein
LSPGDGHALLARASNRWRTACAQAGKTLAEPKLLRQVKADEGLAGFHTSGHLQQTQANTTKGRTRKTRLSKRLLPQAMKQLVSRYAQQQAELVGSGLCATAAITGKRKLALFDPQLSLAAIAVRPCVISSVNSL